MIDEKCWHVVRLSWSYRLQQRKYWSVSRARYPLPTLDRPNDGFQMRELLRPNSYWKLDFYLSADSPYKLPGAAFGLANSQNEQEAVTQLTSSSLGNQYFLTSVSSIASGLRRPIPEYCQAPPSPKGQATMVSRADIDSSGFYWVHETITTKDFKDHLKETTHKVI